MLSSFCHEYSTTQWGLKHTSISVPNDCCLLCYALDQSFELGSFRSEKKTHMACVLAGICFLNLWPIKFPTPVYTSHLPSHTAPLLCMLPGIKALWATERMERSKNSQLQRFHMHWQRQKEALLKSRCTNSSCVEARVLFSSPSKGRGEWYSREGLKEEAQENFSSVLTVPLIMVVFILEIGKS